MNDIEHAPVLLRDVLNGLSVKPDGLYVDATYGRGGHAAAVIAQLGRQGRLYALDRDPEAVAAGQRRFAGESRFSIVQSRFSALGACVRRWGIAGNVDGVLFDLGVSSPQLDDAARGFSFRKEGPLDMRMEREGASAREWLARADEGDIAHVIKALGEERHARRIARAIVRERAVSPIDTTARFAAVIKAAVPARERKDPATRSFQAVRMHVNNELGEIETALPQALAALAPRGRLVVISFHSLEDRLVKNFLRAHAQPPPVDPRRPPAPAKPLCLRLIGRTRPGPEEIAENPRARSAVLRVAERTEAACE